ncbi:MAG: hypothetical protein WCF68_18630 [Terriglobales bacterium]
MYTVIEGQRKALTVQMPWKTDSGRNDVEFHRPQELIPEKALGRTGDGAEGSGIGPNPTKPDR